jgi:putative transcriptional regulator
MAVHHPDEAMLLDYTTGALSEPFAMIVACHLTLCPACRRVVADMEALGGALLEQQAEDTPTADRFAALLAQADKPVEDVEPESVSWADGTGIPRPLLARLPRDPGRWRWLRLLGIDMLRLPGDRPGARLRLLRIRPGFGVPHHRHDGSELALVLKGSFSDDSGRYGRGDLAYAGDGVDHRQIADPGEPCLCVVATTGRLRLTGPLGRLLDPFVRL